MRYDYAVFIGRFQPLHLGHQHVIDAALKEARHVIVLVGSSDAARSIRNPFTFAEREKFLGLAYGKEIAEGRVLVRGLPDRAYNDDAWIREVQRLVDETVLAHGNGGSIVLHGTRDFRIALAGFGKDGTGYYLKMFPEWDEIRVGGQYGTFNATNIREDYLRRSPILPRDCCAPEVVEEMKAFRLTPAFAALVEEREHVEAYRKSWEGAPYPPVFVTVDAVVVQSGHVLLVRRGGQPGKGLLALPGGFVGEHEPLRSAVVRELREETAIADAKGGIPPAMLSSFIDDKASRVFDAPYRSVRGRTITHAFLFRCPDRREMFTVKGSDDAAHAAWYRLGDLRPDEFFEDHWAILEEMIGL